MSMKNKFKVGDRVRILDGSEIPNYKCGWSFGMNDYIGKIFVIKDIKPSGAIKLNGGNFFYWDERGLEKVQNETIVIYRKDNDVIALDKSNGKKAVAKCSPQDEFNFEAGAKLAFERLFAEEPQLYNGKFVVIKTQTSHLTVGKIYEVVDGRFVDNDGYKYPLYNTKSIESFDDLKEYLSGEGKRKGFRDVGNCYSRCHTEIIEVVE